MPKNYYRFDLVPLPYDYDALEPYIDTETMRIHHDKHLGTYVNNLNDALEDYPRLQRLSLVQLLQSNRLLPVANRKKILDNAGGVYNHNFFFTNLRPGKEENKPFGQLAEQINRKFGSFEDFKKQFTGQALSVFGSGWLWLVKNRKGELMLFPTANQDSPVAYGYTPIAVIDLWEHAYYLKHQNRRAEYIEDWWNVVDWQQAEKNYIDV